MTDRPLVTFALFAYNQERFIREAVEGALAQTYKPLEIILSDDCSSDRTFDIMQEMASQYSGPHKIILNRNKKNLGIGAHVNRVMEISHGELIVAAAGDDISFPERTARIVQEFETSRGRTMAVFSDFEEIDEQGNHLRNCSSTPKPGFSDPLKLCKRSFEGISGASNAWHRKVFGCFGPMFPEITFEDRVISFRAALLGEIQHIASPLIQYRRHQNNTVRMFHTDKLADMRQTLECFRWVYRNNERDLSTFLCHHQPGFAAGHQCRREIKNRLHKLDYYLKIHSTVPSEMLKGLLGLAAFGGNVIQGVRLFRRVILDRLHKTAII